MKAKKSFETLTRSEIKKCYEYVRKTYGDDSYEIESYSSKLEKYDFVLCKVDIRKASDNKVIVVKMTVDMSDRRKSYIESSEVR